MGEGNANMQWYPSVWAAPVLGVLSFGLVGDALVQKGDKQ